MTVNSIVFIYCNALALVPSFLIAGKLTGSQYLSRQLLFGIAIFILQAQLLILGIGLSGFLNISGLIVATTLTSGLMFGLYRYLPGNLGIPCPELKYFEPQFFRYVAVFALCALASIWLFKTGILGSKLTWDDHSYHAAVSAQWLIDEKISLVPFSFQSYYPLGPELMSIWFMLPFGDDSFVTLSSLMWITIACASIAVICQNTGYSLSIASLLIALLLATPLLQQMAGSFSATDLAGAALMIAAVAISIQPGSRQSGGRLPDVILSGGLAGLAVGCKIYFAPITTLVLLWWLFPPIENRGKQRLLNAGLFISAALLCGGYWYLRNWVLSGNPIFPAEFGPFSGPFGPEAQSRTTAWAWMTNDIFSLSMLYKQITRFPLGYVIALIGFFCPLLSISFRGVLTERIKSNLVELYLFVIGLAALCLYPFMPFSGTINRPYANFILEPRMIVLVLIVGLILYRRLLVLSTPYSTGFLVLLLAIIGYSSLNFPSDQLSIAIGAGQIGLAIYIFSREWLTNHLRPVSIISVTLLLIGLALWYPYKRAATAKYMFATYSYSLTVREAWKMFEFLPAGTRIATYLSEPTEYTQLYASFGRSLQLRPVAVEANGEARDYLHRTWKQNNRTWWDEWSQKGDRYVRRNPGVDPVTFVRNLEKADVDYVVTSSWSMGNWPPQHKLLQDSGRAKKVYQHFGTAIWELSNKQSPRGDL